MSTTIDSLDIQISTSAGQSAAQIQAIANALGNLKNQGKIGAATSAMKSLAKALDVLNPSLNALNPSKLQQLRGAMTGLANIQKASGLSNVVNTLKKIPDVIDSLNTTTLDKLELSMNRLAKAIAPLAREMDKIGTAFSKLPARVSQVVTATNKLGKATKQSTAAAKEHGVAWNKTSINLMSVIQNLNQVVGAMHFVGDILTATFAEAMEWDGIQYRFGRAFGEDAEEVYAYAQKINDVLGINIQQFMQYSSLYGSLLSGFGMAQEKVTTISVGLTELSYDIWAAYNDRFKSLEAASEAVRSAITGEIEPIRNAGIALTEASLQEFLKGVGMAHISIEKLSEAQKAEVRYAAMMDAAMKQGIVGTYAGEMRTAEGAVRGLSQSFKGLVQAFGSLFIPILQTAIPYLTAFISLVYEAIAAVASFFGVAFFEIDWGSGAGGLGAEMEHAAAGAGGVASGLGGAAAAAKKLKDYTMGFDELNIIQPPDESGGGGGGGGGAGGGTDWDGLDLETMWDNSVFAKASQEVDALKQQLKDWFEEWKTEIAIVAGALAALSVASLVEGLGEALGLSGKLFDSIKEIKKLAALAIVLTIQYTLMSEFFENYIETGEWESYVWAAIVGALGAFGSYLLWGKKGLILSLTLSAVVALEATFEDGAVDSTEEVVTGLTGLATAASAVGMAWKLIKDTDFGMFFRMIATGSPVIETFAVAFPKIAGAFSAIGGWISTAASAVGSFLAGITAPAWAIIAAVIAAIASVAVFLARNWEQVVKVTKEFFKQNIAPKLENIKKHFEKIVEALSPVIDVMKDLATWVGGLVDRFVEWWKAAQPLRKVLDGIIKVIEVLGGIIFGLISGVLAGVFNALVSVFENAARIISGVIQIISGVIEGIVALFSGGDIKAAWQKIWDGVVDVLGGLWHLIIDPIVSFVTGIIDWFVKLWDELVGHSIVPDTIDAIVEWFLSLPGKIFKPVQDFVNGIVKRFKEMWEKIKSWWNTTVAPKLTQSHWKGVFDKVVSGASSKLGEIKGKITEVWDGVKSWFNSNVAPKLTLAYWKEKFNNIVRGIKDKWTEAKTWWDSNKPTLNTVHAVIASIKDKLFDAWETARTWWNNSKSSLSTVSVAVSSIKDKLVTAWNTASEWFSKQSLKLDIKTPHFSVGWNYNISDTMAAVANFLFDKRAIPYVDVKWYAQGGFPGMGEMFVAREAGPELVGRIGSRSAVANNDQIVEAVSRGVYSAVVAAMGGQAGQSEQAINIYLDGKQITAAVEKRQRERGASLMTGGMAYGY